MFKMSDCMNRLLLLQSLWASSVFAWLIGFFGDFGSNGTKCHALLQKTSICYLSFPDSNSGEFSLDFVCFFR